MDDADWFFAGIIIGTVFICVFAGLWMIGDESDIINTKGLGIKICESYGLEYSHRETIYDDEVGGPIPIIYCQDIEKNKLVDGVVLKFGG